MFSLQSSRCPSNISPGGVYPSCVTFLQQNFETRNLKNEEKKRKLNEQSSCGNNSKMVVANHLDNFHHLDYSRNVQMRMYKFDPNEQFSRM